MSGIKYTKSQQSELSSNPYVKSCTEKYITYTDAFKIFCIEQDNLWMYHRDIFHNAGFPEYIVQSLIPKRCLARWRSIIKHSWDSALVWNVKGRKKQEKRDTSKMSKDEYIEYLEAKLALSEALQQWESWKYP